MTGVAEQKKGTYLWGRWIVNHPGKIFGIGLTVHALFLVITAVLWVVHYPILPFVFDNLPLYMNDEIHYLRSEAWTHRDSEIDPGSTSQRRKRSIPNSAADSQEFIEINIKMDQIYKYYTQPELLFAPVYGEDTFESKEDSDFLKDENVATKHDFLGSIDSCCNIKDGVEPFTKRSCSCDPNSHRTRYKRDDDEDDVEEREYLLTTIRLIYEAPDGNIFTKENLQKIAQFEYKLYNMESFQTRYCRLSYILNNRHCQQFYSILRFFDGTFQYVHDDLYDPSFLNVTGVITRGYEHVDSQDSMKFFLSKSSNISSKHNIARSDKTRSMIYFGYPLKEFGNNTKRGEQRKKWTSWAQKELVPILMKYFHEGIGKMKFVFMSYTIYWQEVFQAVFQDWIFIVGGFSFIFLFMWFQIGSLWITGWGILSIITSFFGANLIYNIIIDFKFFGIFNVLALFILLGIGADDIFIFSDTWNLHHSNDLQETLEQKVSAIFKRASIAMLVTSLTTMVAFFVSSFSPLLPVAAFGTFSGLIILVNYISVITFFPAVVMLYHRYFSKYICCCCCNREGTEDKNKRVTLNERVVKFFKTHFFNFVTNRICRWIIFATFAFLVGGAIYLCTTIKLADQTFSLFSPDNIHEIARDHDSFSFMASKEDPKIEIRLVWGLKPQDRSNCPTRKYDTINPCEGNTVWDHNFDLNNATSQMALLELCQKLRYLKRDDHKQLRIASNPKTGENNVTCFIEDMAKFYKNEGSETFYPPKTSLEFPITKEKMKIIIRSHPQIYKNDSYLHMTRPFEMALKFWLTHRYTNESLPDKRKDFNKYLGLREINKAYDFSADEDKREIKQTHLMYTSIVIATDAPRMRLSLMDGLNLMKDWEAYTNQMMSNLTSPLSGGFQTAGFWFWYVIIETLAFQSILACVLGLVLAFVVIFLGTQNIITGLVATFLLACVTVCVVAIMPLAGWTFGLLEALNLCLIVGLAVDYIVHLSEGYHMSQYASRMDRVRDALEHVGISVLSGAITTLGASFFMLFAKIVFFKQFGLFVFATIGFAMLFSLFVLMAFYGMCGPQGYTGSFLRLCKKRKKYIEYQEEDAASVSSSKRNITNSEDNETTRSETDSHKHNGGTFHVGESDGPGEYQKEELHGEDNKAFSTETMDL